MEKSKSQPSTIAPDGKITCPECKHSWYYAPDELIEASEGRMLGLKDLPELARLRRLSDTGSRA